MHGRQERGRPQEVREKRRQNGGKDKRSPGAAACGSVLVVGDAEAELRDVENGRDPVLTLMVHRVVRVSDIKFAHKDIKFTP
jgi:hypothetical protein